MPHGQALTEAEQLEILAAETGQLPAEGFSSPIVRAHFLAKRGVAITPKDFLIDQENQNRREFILEEQDLGLAAERFLGDELRPDGFLHDIVPQTRSALGAGLGLGGGPDLEAIFDKFTILHIAVGAGMAFFKVPRKIAYLVIFGTEVAEVLLRRQGIAPGFFFETPENVIADVVTAAGAFELVKLVPGF